MINYTIRKMIPYKARFKEEKNNQKICDIELYRRPQENYFITISTAAHNDFSTNIKPVEITISRMYTNLIKKISRIYRFRSR